MNEKIQKHNDNTKLTSKATDVASQSFTQLQNSISKINLAINSFLKLKVINFMLNIGKAVLNASSDMTELQNVTDQVFGNMSEDVENFAANGSFNICIKKICV